MKSYSVNGFKNKPRQNRILHWLELGHNLLRGLVALSYCSDGNSALGTCRTKTSNPGVSCKWFSSLRLSNCEVDPGLVLLSAWVGCLNLPQAVPRHGQVAQSETHRCEPIPTSAHHFLQWGPSALLHNEAPLVQSIPIVPFSKVLWLYKYIYIHMFSNARADTHTHTRVYK